MNQSFWFRFGLRVAGIVMKWICSTYRIVIKNPDVLKNLKGKNFVVAFWHGSMVVGWYLQRKNNIHALVSQSKDGAILSTILESWGYKMIRGSSHRGGKEALQEMVAIVKSGASLAVTPDGPKGPKHVMKFGAVRVAQLARVPLVLISINNQKKKLLQSWDRFEIPMPFSKVQVQYIGPFFIDPDLTGEPLNEEVRRIETEWNSIDNRLVA